MAIDVFLDLGTGFAGESRDQFHADEIEVLSYTFGVSNSAGALSTGGAGAGRAAFTDLTVSARQSKATLALLDHVCTGLTVPQGVLSARRATGSTVPQDYYTVTLTNCVVTSVNESAGGDDAVNTSFSLAFAKVQWSYRAQDSNGALATAVRAGWDLAQNVRA